MREISTDDITSVIEKLCIDSNTMLGDDVLDAIRQAHKQETSEVGKEVL